jgi:hypothetical protein
VTKGITDILGQSHCSSTQTTDPVLRKCLGIAWRATATQTASFELKKRHIITTGNLQSTCLFVPDMARPRVGLLNNRRPEDAFAEPAKMAHGDRLPGHRMP